MSINETATGTEEERKTGRPRKFPPGRVSVYMRVTRQRAEELKAEAERNGRSVSEQVEFIIQDHARVGELIAKLARSDAETQGLLAQINDHMDQIYKEQHLRRKFQDEARRLKGEVQKP